MTRKDYVLIADAISSMPWSDTDDETTICKVIDALAEVLARDNPKFNVATFKTRCLPK